MAAYGSFNDAILNEKDKATVQAYSKAWNDAVKAGDNAAADKYHQAAEAIRAQYDYSGGADGSSYIPLAKTETAQNGYSGTTLPSATSQESYIKDLYSAANDATIASLKSAYEKNMADIDYSAQAIPQYYYSAKNQAAGQNAQSKRTWNEYAAASGLNSGTSGQGYLALENQLQGDLSALNRAKANALADVEHQRLQAKIAYQNDINQAIANNQLELASALYQEAIRVDNSIVSTALNQANMDFNTWQANYSVGADNKANAQAQVDAMLQAGVTPSADLLAQAGYTNEYVNTLANYYKNKGSSSSSSSSPTNSSNPVAPTNNQALDLAKSSIAMNKAAGYTDEQMFNVLSQWESRGLFNSAEMEELYKAAL